MRRVFRIEAGACKRPPAPSPKNHQSITLAKLSNVFKRVIFGVAMVLGFLVVISMGPTMIILAALIIQVLCFKEILDIGYNYNKITLSLPYFRCLCWYFLAAANYFFYGETVAPHFRNIYQENQLLNHIVAYHRFFSFCFYLVGIVLFVFSLVRKHDLKQFRILARTHTLFIIIVLQSYLVIENIFQGLIWVILPVSLVILNDIFAYIFGRLWGKTPLIEVSPKKTWEGFIGGLVGTFASGYILSHIMCQYQYFVCPTYTDCTLSYLFEPVDYQMDVLFVDFTVTYYRFGWHFLSLALFASLVAPFGGFCASGFKRAFKIKDFGDVIPGHGGIMDRFDCQFLMATFVNVYIFTFVRNPTPDLIYQKFLYLDEDSQVKFYQLLRDSLVSSGVVNETLVSSNHSHN